MAEDKSSKPPQSGILDQYKIYVQDVGNIGSRNENSRRFYLSIVSALFVFLSIAGEKEPFDNPKITAQVIVGIVGFIVCIFWIMHVQSFAAIFRAKFKVLSEIEEKQGLFPIFGPKGREWTHLGSDPRYTRLAWIDSKIPIVFALLFFLIMFMK